MHGDDEFGHVESATLFGVGKIPYATKDFIG
jgi:hypothetical protein